MLIRFFMGPGVLQWMTFRLSLLLRGSSDKASHRACNLWLARRFGVVLVSSCDGGQRLTQHDLDWVSIRADFEAGSSLSALERKYLVSRQAIKKRSVRESWKVPGVTNPEVAGNSYQRKPSRDANAAMRVAEAIKYRQAGWTYARIAEQCGYSDHSAARQAIQRELDRHLAKDVDEWRQLHMSRLETMHEWTWDIAKDPKNKGRLFAIDRLLQIQERQSKLMGLDKPASGGVASQVVVRYMPAGYLGTSEVKQ